ncbi:uncharacterized protein EI90DRAFT_207193 [Cantharellus anzutake]|uniref:uncharacterized protein n=1 Tax=Cantharellus anzutake TaxID=1750568 RepID=UPI0019089646|nr:uncharacterized protein EI90DRAFT_207193 [Cantharellus anzutake]KAF8317277.1 hypothetical protein EI90DRAFT_207193 [Cantharellus anzutake]
MELKYSSISGLSSIHGPLSLEYLCRDCYAYCSWKFIFQRRTASKIAHFRASFPTCPISGPFRLPLPSARASGKKGKSEYKSESYIILRKNLLFRIPSNQIDSDLWRTSSCQCQCAKMANHMAWGREIFLDLYYSISGSIVFSLKQKVAPFSHTGLLVLGNLGWYSVVLLVNEKKAQTHAPVVAVCPIFAASGLSRSLRNFGPSFLSLGLITVPRTLHGCTWHD